MLLYIDMKKQKPTGLLEVLRKKYLVMLILIGVLAIMLPSYLAASPLSLGVGYGVLALLALPTCGLYFNFFWQKLWKRLRSYIVGRILQVVALIAFGGLLFVTVPDAYDQSEWIPYGTLWLLGLALVWQYSSVFVLAHQAKRDHPERCDFC
jgi:hypothetical protein